MGSVQRSGEGAIVYDGSLTGHVEARWFEPAHWPDAVVAAAGRSGGRGRTLFIRHDGQDWALRHYYRGGLFGRLVREHYFWTGEHRCRPFREWRLLASLYRAGLPVPRPVAARYRRRGVFYTADLITMRIPGARPFSQRVSEGAVGAADWRRVGACIARFHAAGVFHADLNAHNLQMDADDRVFLLDFDRGRLMPGSGGWQEDNLRRLRRSLRRISRNGAARFGEADWRALLEGYRGHLQARSPVG